MATPPLERHLLLLEFVPAPAPPERETIYACLSPASIIEAETRGLPHVVPHHLLPSRAIQKELNANWNRLERLIGLIDEHVPVGRAAAYHYRLMMDSCAEKIALLDEVLTEVRPASVSAVATQSDFLDCTMAFSEDESLYSRVLPPLLKARHPHIELRSLGPLPRQRYTLLAARARAAASTALRAIKLLRTAAAPPFEILYVEGGYGLDEILGALKNRSPPVRWAPSAGESLPQGLGLRGSVRLYAKARPTSAERAACLNAWREIADDPRTAEIFSHRGVCYFEVVSSRLEHMFRAVYPSVLAIQRAGEEFLRQSQTKLVVSSFFSRPQTYAIATAAARAGVPVVTLQHGSYGYWDWPLIRYSDTIMSDFKLVGGEGAARFFEATEKRRCAIPTGLPFLDPLIVRRKERPPSSRSQIKIVYPLASYVKNYIPYANSRLSINEYFEINRVILRELGSHQHVQVIVRPHPAFRRSMLPLQEWIRSQGWSNVRVDYAGETVDAMTDADLVVIDSPSTVLLHALAVGARVAVLNPIFPMTSEGRSMLQRATAYSENLEEFVERLRALLLSREFGSVPGDGEHFLRAYATHAHDGRSTGRATDALEKILAGENPVAEPPNAIRAPTVPLDER